MKHFIFSLCLIVSVFGSNAQSTLTLDSTVLNITTAIDSTMLNGPWDLEWGFDNRLWMTDVRKIRVYDTLTHNLKTLQTLSRGNLLGLAVPKFVSAGIPYVYAILDTSRYYLQGNFSELHRYTYSAGADTLIGDTILLRYNHNGEHVGGKVVIGGDGKIYLTTADYTYADSVGFKWGKVLRLNQDGSVPNDNPRADYTWSYGHRNPEGMVVLPDGKIYVSEHGQFGPDELNYILRGRNYGWPAYMGTTCTGVVPDTCNSATFTYEYPKALTGFPPGGVEYYSYPQIPEWKGCLLVGALLNGMDLVKFSLNATHDTVRANHHYSIPQFGRMRDICAAPDGSIYMIINDRSAPSSSAIYKSNAMIVRLKNNNYTPTAVTNIAASRGVNIYPNPARGLLHISIANPGKTGYQIFDNSGRMMAQGSLLQADTVISIAGWPEGAYTMVINTQGGTATKTFIILK